MVTSADDDNRQACSTDDLEDALKILDGRWKALIIFHLFKGPYLRFSELMRAIPSVSQKMLIQQLRDLESSGVVIRKVYAEAPPRVEYSLSADGMALRPALFALQTWAASRTFKQSDPAAAPQEAPWPMRRS